MGNPTHEWMASVERRVELLHELLRTYDLRLGIAEAKAGELQKQLTSLLNLGYEGMREQLAALAEARLDERVKSLERRCHTLASWQHAAEAASDRLSDRVRTLEIVIHPRDPALTATELEALREVNRTGARVPTVGVADARAQVAMLRRADAHPVEGASTTEPADWHDLAAKDID